MSESIKGLKRTGYCAGFGAEDAGKIVTVMGWVQRRRDLGGLIFIDLRDRTGIIQCTFDSSGNKELFDKAFGLRSEYVIAVTGTIAPRAEGAVNKKLPTGEIEIISSDLRVFSKAETPPFEIVENSEVNDVLRLKYRYLDLRRPDMQRIFALRHRVALKAREYFSSQGFLEIETPILTKSTPEGARDYLVPSRVHPGKFYALPQSPQQYKQLLMVAGFDRYFQITRCLRDEDLRADRQPEFTQIDLEMSFVDVDDVIAVNEGFLAALFKEVMGVEIQLPLPRLSYKEAMERYGSDKPDLRFGYELRDLTDIAARCGFKVFSDAASAGGRVGAVKIDGGAARFSRKEIDALTEFVKTYKAKGLAWFKISGGETSSSFAKFMTEQEMAEITERTGAGEGDIVFIVADGKKDVVFASLGSLRCECARRLDTIQKDVYKLLWVVEFPLYEYNEEEGRFSAMHHPFTAPLDEDEELIEKDPAAVRAKAYDIVLNGYELGGGSIRIHKSELQERMFAALGFTPEDARERFGHMIEAFRYGAPPHGGLAFGLDRLVMLLAGRDNLRDVIAFPKVQNASELMMNSPDVVDARQLDELGLALVPKSGENE